MKAKVQMLGQSFVVSERTPRKCALLGITAAGDSARFPVEVYDLESGDQYKFVESNEQTNVEEKKPSGRVSLQKANTSRAVR